MSSSAATSAGTETTSPFTAFRPPREGGRREASAGSRPGHTKLNIRDKSRSRCSTSGTQGDWMELRAPQGATPTTLRMQAQTAARYEDVLAHVTLGLRGRVGRAAVWSPYGTRPVCGTRGISHPRNGRVPEPPPPTIRCAAGVPGGRWGSVVYGWRAPRPPRVVFVLGVACLINSLTSGKKALALQNPESV